MATTPMMRQWAQIKRAYPDCVILFRLGDFYEAFHEEASRVADICDVVLTSRPVQKGQRVPMAGVPYHAVDSYIAQLVRHGVKVAIAEQSGPESSPEKRARMSRVPGEGAPATGGAEAESDGSPAAGAAGRDRLMTREVVRIVTPGTIVEGDLLDARAPNYLAAFAHEQGRLGLAHVELSTGEFATTQLEGPDAERRLLDEIVRLQPAEIVHADGGTAGDRATLAGRLQDAVTALGLPTALMPYPRWHFDLENARRALLDHFRVASVAAYGCEELPAALVAAGAAIAYVTETQQGAVAQIGGLATYSSDSYMGLDSSTRRNLEITATLRGERKGSLLWAMDATATAMGARTLRTWLEQPLLDTGAIEARLDAVEGLMAAGVLRAELAAALKGMPDLQRLANRIVAGYAGPREMRALARGLAVVPALAAALEAGGILPDIAERLADPVATETARAIGEAIADEPPAMVGVSGVIRAGYAAQLDEVQAAVADARGWIGRLEASERARTGIRSLKVGYNKVFGYYLEVPKSQQERVPDDYHRKQTLVDAERYITPELKVRENEVMNAEERIISMERELYGALVRRISDAAGSLLAVAREIGALDALVSLAEVAVRHGYTRPKIVEGRELVLVGARHPVVERARSDTPFVPNDLRIGEGQIVILTGPNMAGKSTVARQAALIAIMAQTGSFVPAESALIGLVDRIFTRIGAQDELAAGRSTFMVEMVEAATILQHASPRSLVILDELGRGTSTYDGMAIAWAVLEHIHNSPRLGARTLFATHYHELTVLADQLPRVRNYNMAVSESDGRVVFLHRIEPGSADRSYGIHVGELAGLPREVVERAWQILARLEAQGNVPLQAADGRPPPAPPAQLALFAPAVEEHPVLAALAELSLDEMTPRQALAILYEWQPLVLGRGRRKAS